MGFERGIIQAYDQMEFEKEMKEPNEIQQQQEKKSRGKVFEFFFGNLQLKAAALLSAFLLWLIFKIV